MRVDMVARIGRALGRAMLCMGCSNLLQWKLLINLRSKCWNNQKLEIRTISIGNFVADYII